MTGTESIEPTEAEPGGPQCPSTRERDLRSRGPRPPTHADRDDGPDEVTDRFDDLDNRERSIAQLSLEEDASRARTAVRGRLSAIRAVTSPNVPNGRAARPIPIASTVLNPSWKPSRALRSARSGGSTRRIKPGLYLRPRGSSRMSRASFRPRRSRSRSATASAPGTETDESEALHAHGAQHVDSGAYYHTLADVPCSQVIDRTWVR